MTKPGGWAWVGLANYVILADSVLALIEQIAKEENEFSEGNYSSMSVVFDGWNNHPRYRWLTLAGWSVLTMHLFKSYLPKELHILDPITFLGDTIVDNVFIPLMEKSK